MKLALVAFASLLCATSARAGDESLLPMRTLASGISSYGQMGLFAADLDGNGRKDIVSVALEEAPYYEDVFSIGPHGDLLSHVTLQLYFSSFVAAGDFDGDGFEDLAVSHSDGYVSVYRGGPDGVPKLWQTITLPPPAEGLFDIEVADFNDDGWPDILVCKLNSASTSPFKLLRNLGGSAGFSTQTALAASGMKPLNTALGDLNGDGRLDVLAAEYNTGLVRVLLANFSGLSFTNSTTLQMADDVGDVCAVDLTADGVPDIAATIIDAPSGGITCAPGTGGGNFGAAVQTLVADGRIDLDTGDIDGDGDMDIVQGSEAHGTYGWTNTGSLPLAAPKSIHTQPDTAHVLMADVNGDGWSDLAANPSEDRGITLVYGGPQGLQVPAATTLILDATGLHAADFNGDGLTDVLGIAGHQLKLSAGNGDGTLGPAVLTNGPIVTQSIVALCNGDALPDLILLNPSGPRLKLMLSLGDSLMFKPGDDEILSAGPVAGVLAADLDGDGALEICVPTADGQMRILHLDASTNFVPFGNVPVPEIVGLSQAVYPMAAGDVDGDGLLDVAFAGYALKKVFVFPGQPGGMLGPATILDLGPDLSINQVLIGDVNEDGLGDVLGMGGGASWGTTTLWPGQPGLQFAAPQTIAGGWYEPQLADLNADGHLDLVSFRDHWLGEPRHIAVQSGLGNGQFATASKFFCDAVHLDVADFSSDGVPDVVTLADFPEIGGPNSDEASVFISRPFTPFDDLGYALAGSKGEPEFLAWGWLQPGQTTTLSVARAKPLAQAALFVGLSQAMLPFKGGTLVPSVDLLLPAFVTDSKGRLELPLSWPAGVPSELSFSMQWWFADASGPSGLTASNALSATTP